MTQHAKNGTAYALQGPEQAPVVVLIHGLGLNRHCWQWHLSFLSDHYRVLSYDLYGHGDSTPPPELPSLTLFARQLKDLLDELAITDCSLVGFSLGGMINRRFAMDYPGLASSLVILNSPHERGEEAQKLVEERATQTAAGGPAATIETTLARWFTETFRTERTDIVDLVRGWVLKNDPDSYTQCRRVLAHGVIELIRPSIRITLPTLVITSENDSGSTPEMSFGIAGEIDGSETLIIPDLQHMGLVEEPEAFMEPVIGFLSTLHGSGHGSGTEATEPGVTHS